MLDHTQVQMECGEYSPYRLSGKKIKLCGCAHPNPSVYHLPTWSKVVKPCLWTRPVHFLGGSTGWTSDVVIGNALSAFSSHH